ncbi:MAG: DUF4919 domain-containing protein [Firmicutes bacterium]|nr:DUF4919 domain-containing protein [Bacillota bacterium]MCM1400475.1 DUF4919 domain-containing protein [Bacteroides sp.]MCM1477446.1 DUF4919 domain-containing protein [Bacteroides sp.]
MKRFLTSLLITASVVAGVFAANPKYNVDRQAISSAVSDHGAYKALADRFATGQKLSTSDMAALYYGTALQPGFSATQTYPDINRTYAAGDYTTTLSQVWKALAKDPANLYLLFTGYGAARSLNNQEAADLLQTRLLQVCDLIFASGMGVSQDSPYVVLRPSDIDEFLVKYIQPTTINGRAKISNLEAVRVNIDGVPDDVIMYFKQF